MRPTWIVACLTLVGCRQIFGLDGPTRVDGSIDDAFVEVDAPDAGPCTGVSSTCAGTNTLRTCDAAGGFPTDTTCGWGCDSTGVEGICKQLVPSGGVLLPADLAPTAGIEDVEINSGTSINTDTGAITGIRLAGSGVISGIKFELRSGGGVFTMQTLTLSASLVASGTRPLVIVALDGVTINSGGTLDLRGTCTTNVGGPGGGVGGLSGEDADPAGGQGGGNNEQGGGGGGYGGPGGLGGNGGAGQGPNGGQVYGNAAITTLVGGAGGGGGGDNAGGGLGGGGGGAVQIATNEDVLISGVINAGGCGGKTTITNDSGGGGGAGGAILIEAVGISILGTLAVNGGGGGGAEGGTPGENGAASRVAAKGGTSPEGPGGDGAAGADLSADDGFDGGNNAGGGGGGLGRIRLNSRAGSVFVGGGAVMSPDFSDGATATQGAAAIQ